MQLLFETTADGNHYINWLLSGLMWTIALWIGAALISSVLGIVVGCGRTAENRAVRFVSRAYVQVFRNIPLLLQAFLWYFVFPEIVPAALGAVIKSMPPPWSSFIPALIAIGLYTGARVAEQVRAGIQSLPKGQREAGHALGFSALQQYSYVLIPQALRTMAPSLTSEALALLKNTSVAMTIGLLDLTAQAQQMNEFTFRTFESFGYVTLVYFLLSLAIYWFAVALINKYGGAERKHRQTANG
ncbi:glutamate/aspartate transport system permease protein [Paraburkholderia fungorum]|jgi:glutamate/aspartate transport system permease protein|uniref:amino acid ABC transporter permease n=1 Tax=Paraburkholderia fungorum TaxID=134537 RepID=UPI001621ADFB|nr:amino acid ABC transporter permease [Paraburkholderia fungorum]MBB4519691.1 glutamate/aspartate transport system permease protein [Paraburkholderia fungorum]